MNQEARNKSSMPGDAAGMSETMDQARSRLVNAALVALAVFGVPAVLGSVIRARDVGWQNVMYFHIVAFAYLAVIAVFRNRLSYVVRVSSLLFTGYIIGVAGLFTWGLSGMGIIFLFSISTLATAFFGLQFGFFTAAFCALSIGIIGLLVAAGVHFFNYNIIAYAYAPTAWFTAVTSFGFFMAIVVVSLGRMHQALESSILGLKDHAVYMEQVNESLLEQVEERERAEERHQKSEEKYRLVVENAADAICIVCQEQVVYANPYALSMLGYTLNEINKIHFTKLLHPEDRDTAAQRHDQRIEGTLDSRPFLYRFITKDKTIIYSQLSGVPIEWEGEPGLLVMARDLTQQVELEKQLRQSERMRSIGTLAGGVAHDFNNLLMGIQGNLSLMELELEPESSLQQKVTKMEQFVQEAKELTDQLLGFAREGKYQASSLDLKQLLENSLDMFGRAHKEIRIETFWDAMDRVEADAGQLEQVFMNLFVNAWQAMEGGGTLTLAGSSRVLNEDEAAEMGLKPRAYVKITLTDTGAGMEPEVLERVFEPFFSTRERGRGTGLGLASAHGIVKNHGGAISVKSRPGKGSQFTIYLPSAKEEAPVMSDQPAG